MKKFLATLVIACVCAHASLAHAALPGGISGAWFNPAQGGHGLSVEILDRDRALVFWYVYDPAGRPVHLYIEGDIAGRRIVGTAYYNEGMRFGVFDPAERRQSRWGEVAIDFDDCDHARFTWAANGPAGVGYGDGAMPLTRLTSITGASCPLVPRGMLPPGVYQLSFESGRSFDAAVDPDGRLWGTTTHPHSTHFLGVNALSPMLRGAITGAPADDVTVTGEVFNSGALQGSTARRARFTTVFDVEPDAATASFQNPLRLGASDRVDLAFDRAATAGVAQPFPNDADLFRQWFGHLRAQFFSEVVGVSFQSGNEICIDLQLDAPSCDFVGTFTPSHAGWTFFDFTVTRAGEAPYVGRGWLVRGGDRIERIVLVGDNGTQGLGVTLYREAAP